MSKLDRRTVLKSLTAATTAPFLPGCPQPTPGPTASSVRDVITHVVILMMENRSFDTFLGSYSLTEGRSAVDGLTAGMSNAGVDGMVHPVHLADRACVLDPPHGWNASHGQWNNGLNDGFIREHENDVDASQAYTPMQYWTRKTLSATYALADRYTICDRWFCSLLGPTWPNRFYSHAATNNGYFGNDGGGDYSMPTIYQALTARGVSWGCYHLTAPLMALLPGHYSVDTFHEFDRFLIDAQYGLLPQVSVIEPLYGRADDHPPAHPLAGQILIQQIYQALANSPHWGNIQFFITYDEHGGFFDHVPPPELPDERADQGFGQAGFRVPSLAIGPYVKQGAVSSTVYDHTSMLAFIEELFDLDPLTMRDGAANNLFDTLDTDRVAAADPSAPITLAPIVASEEEIYADECVVGLDREVHGLLHQPEFEAWLDALPMQHPTDNRERLDDVYESWLRTAEEMGVWRRG